MEKGGPIQTGYPFEDVVPGDIVFLCRRHDPRRCPHLWLHRPFCISGCTDRRISPVEKVATKPSALRLPSQRIVPMNIKRKLVSKLMFGQMSAKKRPTNVFDEVNYRGIGSMLSSWFAESFWTAAQMKWGPNQRVHFEINKARGDTRRATPGMTWHLNHLNHSDDSSLVPSVVLPDA